MAEVHGRELTDALLRKECEARGLPVSLAALLLHINNSHASIVGFKDLSIKLLRQHFEDARADATNLAVAAKTAEKLLNRDEAARQIDGALAMLRAAIKAHDKADYPRRSNVQGEYDGH